jgi:hypothetical protein
MLFPELYDIANLDVDVFHRGEKKAARDAAGCESGEAFVSQERNYWSLAKMASALKYVSIQEIIPESRASLVITQCGNCERLRYWRCEERDAFCVISSTVMRRTPKRLPLSFPFGRPSHLQKSKKELALSKKEFAFLFRKRYTTPRHGSLY